jgi:hypothetical protein
MEPRPKEAVETIWLRQATGFPTTAHSHPICEQRFGFKITSAAIRKLTGEGLQCLLRFPTRSVVLAGRIDESLHHRILEIRIH